MYCLDVISQMLTVIHHSQSTYDIVHVQYFVTTYADQCGHGCIVVAKLMIPHMLAVWSGSAGSPVISTALLRSLSLIIVYVLCTDTLSLKDHCRTVR